MPRTQHTTRPQRRSKRRIREQKFLEQVHLNAAGIDIGFGSHWVAVPPDRDEQPVREFRSFTHALIDLADWLTACDVDTVAMESTGVYWIPLYEILEARGFSVLLVNARHVKNVPGRKSECLPSCRLTCNPQFLRASDAWSLRRLMTEVSGAHSVLAIIFVVAILATVAALAIRLRRRACRHRTTQIDPVVHLPKQPFFAGMVTGLRGTPPSGTTRERLAGRPVR